MVEHMTDDRKVPCSNPAGAASKLGQFNLLHFASDFRKIH